MKFAVFNSIPEALMYVLLFLVLILNIVGLDISARNAQTAKTLSAKNQQQITCIAAFFLLVPNRTSASLKNLANNPNCAATIKAIQQ